MTVIDNALTGAFAAQVALATTSQNVANVMTPGYTRQGVALASVQPLQGGVRSPGSGVSVQSITRFSDAYKVQQLWSSAANLGQSSVSQPYFTQLEQVMGDDTSSISGGLDNFFGALNAASVDPTSNPLRQQVIASANSLAQRFNSLTQVLTSQRTAVFQQRSSMVQQISTLTADIASFNQQIVAAQGTGANTSGLVDARDQKIDELSGLVSVQVVRQPDGSDSVSLSGGQPLVIGNLAGTMTATVNASGSQNMAVQFATQSFAVTSSQAGGQLGGLGAYETGTLIPFMQVISGMAQQFSSAMNTQLTAGYDLNGAPGATLFTFTATGVTGTLSVNPSITGDQLAFSSNPATPGNSDNLQTIIALQASLVSLPPLGAVSLSDAMTQLVGLLGTQSQQNQTALSTAQTVRDQADSTWKSTSGVNSDEEAANLVQYQQMYQANMKVISVANTLLQSTLDIIK
jgi:flagellar hook-associated protein 1 FlgK